LGRMLSSYTALECRPASITSTARICRTNSRFILTGYETYRISCPAWLRSSNYPHPNGRICFSVNFPQYAVLSVGRGTAYGHPIPAGLHAYEEERATVLRTDRDGAILVRGQLLSSDITVTRMGGSPPAACRSFAPPWCGKQKNWHCAWALFLARFA